MYLIYCAIALYIFANLSKNKLEWFVLSVLFSALWLNKEYFSNTDQALYFTRAFLCFITACYLSSKATKLALYQAFIILVILTSYAALAYDVANNKHILIYNNFEGVVHGLVACQFIGILPELRDFCRNNFAVNFSRKKYNKGV